MRLDLAYFASILPQTNDAVDMPHSGSWRKRGTKDAQRDCH